tara:strand:- start:19977 stop:35876 length:15900 start_codon:yes stop_codon:yes gene_type:complete
MAYNKNDQNELPLPNGGSQRRKSSQHLPRYFRTRVNNKFLASTVDQLIQPGVAEKLNGYFGREDAKGRKSSDVYIGDVSDARKNYQFEPVTVIQDAIGNVNYYSDYNDYINQLSNLGSSVKDHSILNRQEYYAWNPHISWDKFVNFREYYWLPNGPQTVQVYGQSDEVISTYTVSAIDNGENFGYVFSPDGLTQNPQLTLYRGVTYRFEIDAPGNPLSFRTRKQTAAKWKPNTTYDLGESVLYNGSVYIATGNHNGSDVFDVYYWNLDTGFNLTSNISAQGVEKGVIELTLDDSSPDIIYYLSDSDIFASGVINVKDITEATSINVESEIIGMKSYTTGTGFALSNGMKIDFIGKVTPEKYAIGAFYVEGVGDKIQLIAEEELNIPSEFTSDLVVEFDNEGFDRLPYSEAIGYPLAKDYITLNRGSVDGNLWSKYNRWFHKDVIETSARINNQETDINENNRATRPIVEFNSGLKLFNYGTKSKTNVDLVDTFTKDVFSTVEGASGYNVDNVDLTNGMRIVFLADTDPLVVGRIFEVKFITVNNTRQITLVETADSLPLENETMLCKQGSVYKGKVFWYNGKVWNIGQSKTTVNQSPLFDVYNENGITLSDTTVYESSTFTGTSIFGYKLGTGAVDTELGFPLSYRSIENVGDISFNFNLLLDTLTYIPLNQAPTTLNISSGYLRTYTDRTSYENSNGWKKSSTLSEQSVIRQYTVDNTRTFYTIDVYDQSGLLTDLWVRVILNNQLLFENKDYTLTVNAQNDKVINFITPLSVGDNIIIKTRSSAVKNNNGKYEIANNLERNPLNEDITEFTLGEVNDHVGTIVEETNNFLGIFPGSSNLRDLGQLSSLGKRIVKHSAPLNLSAYHLTDKDANIVKSIKFARREYGKFKRAFLQYANNIGYSGPTKEHVDLILVELTKDKISSMPFYFTDMVPFGAAAISRIEIEDVESNFYALSTPFNLTDSSSKAVQIYLNGVQLVHSKDYTFNDQGFAVITAEKSIGDVIEIYEYENTNGSYIPATPTKLGLFPKYEPSIFVDTTYLEPQTVIQGHDGSITIAFGDFRDDLILELEKRIFNNLKVEYDTSMFDIYDYVPGHSRKTGLTEAQINEGMLSDFVQWLQLVDTDYTANLSFNRADQFTFNHTGMSDPEGSPVHGWWRAVYKYAYDTDRPHTHPWEMLGFTIKPTWWEAQYGEAPYTSNNFLMWEDIEAGVIRTATGSFHVNEKYKRDNLTTHLPVDEDGNLVSPLLSSFITTYNTTDLNANFVYGDHSPVETAWRRNSEYAFALLTSLFLNQPSRTISVCFDRIRQVRDLVGDIVYINPNRQIRLTDIEFPNTVDDSVRIFTSGFVNYVTDYLASSVSTSYDNYKDSVKSINNQIGFKLGGYTSKDKFKLILDSRTPLNKGNVFVPEENYKVFLNTSTPIKIVSYSGVIIEKQSYGFIIKGYDNERPYFDYFPAKALANDSLINVGGVSSSFVYWETGKTYTNGSIVENENAYYRAIESHVSGTEFDNTKFAKLPKLPEVGGREAFFRKAFRNSPDRMPYGKVLKTIQEVVDFLLGYGQFLESQGFVFDYYSASQEFVANWKTSAKEFMFWTTQNWGAGSVITLSPAAYQIKFISEYAVVDDIYDTFYGYSLLKADGKKLQKNYVSLTRENPNEFIISPKATEDGIFSVKLALVQKEHAVLIDNKTVFGDVIYDQEPGYRQERVRVLGYKTAEWDGSINIPGFVFDNAKVTEWKTWTDYAIGDLVQYKEFYYTARDKISGTGVFESNNWVRLAEKPEMELRPNFEYKVNQFADFYDLDTDNFDVEQQKFAQHLIGYQNRDYLANIINDDVSQYKFYQGMIQDKGTRNALTKLFDVLSSNNKDSLEFYEEWAIKVGQYGAADGFEEVEFLLDESKFKLAPQSIELTNTVTGDETDLVYRIKPFEVYLRPANYTHAPFPSKTVEDTYTKNSGYVNPDDVDFIVENYDSILDIEYATCMLGNTIWVGNKDLSWDIYAHVKLDLEIETVEKSGTDATLVLSSTVNGLSNNDIIGITYTDTAGLDIDGFYSIKEISNNKITLLDLAAEDATVKTSRLSALISVRVVDLVSASTLMQDYQDVNRIWIDKGINGQWEVLERTPGYNLHQVVPYTELGSDHEYGSALATDGKNTVLAVGAPDSANGKVYIYTRAGNSGSYQLSQNIEADSSLAKVYPSYLQNTPSAVGDIIFYNNNFYRCLINSANTAIIVDDGFGNNINEPVSETWDRYALNFTKIQTPADTQHFGASLAISEDGTYLVVGSPNASEVKTTYQGDYDTSSTYGELDIVRYEDTLWKALIDIDPAVQNIKFGSFESVPNIMQSLAQEEADDTIPPVLLAGDYPFTNVITDHLLIKAPFDMYAGSKAGDTLSLKWNTQSNAHQDTVVAEVITELSNSSVVTRSIYSEVQPFNGEISAINESYLTGKFEISEKVDAILYVENSNTVPLVGQIVETTGGFGTVTYKFVDGAKVTIYVKDVNGTFGTVGSLTTNIGEYVGEYITSAPTDIAPDADTKWGGYWRIDTDEYTVDNVNSDEGRGLVIYDVIPSSIDLNQYTDKTFYNILDYYTSVVSSKDNLNSQLHTLSYTGAPGLLGVIGQKTESLFLVKSPKALTDVIEAGLVVAGDPNNPKLDIFYNSMPSFLSGEFNDPAAIGLALSDLNKQHIVYDVWDGYIDVTLTQSDQANTYGPYYEPKKGLTIRDKTNFGEAEIAYIQKFNTTSIRLYLKNIQGNWALGNNFGENREVVWISEPGGSPYYAPLIGTRPFGQINERSFPSSSQGLGKFIVFDTGSPIDVTGENIILDSEYWMYEEQEINGIPRAANIPSITSNDWEQTFNVPTASAGDPSALTKEGMYSVYERRGAGQYVKLNSFIVPERANNMLLGSDVKLSKSNDLYKLFIKMTGNNDFDSTDPENPGRIYMVLNGSTDDYQFGWEFSRDKKYKGQFSSTRDYNDGDIVYYDGILYTAITNIAQGVWVPTDWEAISDPKDYVGYIPNVSGLNVGNDSAVIDSDYLTKFAKDFDVNSTGDVIVVSTEYFDKPNSVYVYRNVNGQFYRAQTIVAPNKTTSYGDSVSISHDGKIIAVGAAFDDSIETDSGKVYIYAEQNGIFVLTQELTSPTKERAEFFGSSIDFDGTRLAIGSRNGDSFVDTTIDVHQNPLEWPTSVYVLDATSVERTSKTTFDSGFTKFKSFDKDSGIVRVYERRGDVIGYAQHLDYDVPNVTFFGSNLKLTNNHVYVGLPNFQRTETRQGVVIDYRIPDNTTVWNSLRSSKSTVDVNKIKRVMLYDVNKSEILQYLDYIDVLQGKIAGPAEQELSYKTYYDPAVYTTGSLVNIDATNSWGASQVGQLWWDLTNAKFLNPYQENVIFSTNNWNLPFSDSNTIDVYEWVETTYLPSEWDAISGTDVGVSEGITGTSRYSDDAYAVKRKYDTASGTFTTYYYFWVKNKTTIPNIENRVLSANNVANLIKDPANEGYRFVSFISPTEISLTNCEGLIRGTDIALSIQYWTIENQEINIHNQYQIITEGLDTSIPNRDVENKWIDSLVGFDTANRIVPATNLSAKEKYGILNNPRQGWFVNKAEALNQLITRVNSVLINTLIIDDKDISSLTNIDPAPSASSNRFDRSIDTLLELQFIGVAKATQAKLTPVIENGKIVRIVITNAGRGYLVPPTVTVLGSGSGAVVETTIDNNGSITSATILEQGESYGDNTALAVRRYTVLVNADSTLNGKWALYERDTDRKEWLLVESQAYDVSKYWNYVDWYDIGYSAFTNIDFILEFPYDLPSINSTIGDIVKINNVGTGGWLLLEKIDNQDVVDYSVNYKTIGRENGTIQFKSTLYDVTTSLVGYDTTTYDVLSFDGLPSTETRIILNALKNNIFIDELAIEWNKLFFASLRYVFSEQKYVDWAFKTSFIKAKHNVGELGQPINFKNDNLPSYEEYIKEVKPYKTKIREYLSSYDKIDNSQTITTDFDLPPKYISSSNSIQPQVVKVIDDTLVSRSADLDLYPNKNWADNVGYVITDIKLANAGSGYANAPIIKIQGSGTGATAVASLGRGGSISLIKVTNPGKGYLTAPLIVIDGSVDSTGTPAKAVAIIGNTAIRTIHTAIKFDRVSGVYEFVNLNSSETVIASGSQIRVNLEWPMDLRTTKVAVFNNNDEVLGRRYTYRNVLDQSKGYDRYYGQIEFIDPPAAGTIIRVDYSKDIKLLKAQDRINVAYTPESAQFGNTLGQLMDGVDYGGVEVRAFDFGGTTGWDSGNWFTQGWDVYDTTFEDEIFVMSSTLDSNGNVIQRPTYVDLSKPLEINVEYNIYRQIYDAKGQLIENTRMDDPAYEGIPMIDKPWVSTLPIIGDGVTTQIDLDARGISVIPDDSTIQTISIIIRKATSDGSFLADPDSYDTAIDGGNLGYASATGLNAADINIDGDGFVTATTSKGPEEIVPGQVLDTLDITVYEKPTGGASQITSRNYIGNGIVKSFKLSNEPGKLENLFVKINYTMLTKDDYTIDFDTKEIIFNTAPALNARISIVDVGLSAAVILDIDNFKGDGVTNNFLTNARWQDNANNFVTVDGVVAEVTLLESDESYAYPNNFVIRFATPPAADANIKVMLAVGGVEVFEQYSQVLIDEFVADGSTLAFELGQAPFALEPESAYTIVKVNNKILNPGYSARFDVTAQREYQLDLTQIPVASVNSYDLAVFLNNTELEYVQDWVYEGAGVFDSTLLPQSQAGSTITLQAGIGEPGDVLRVFVLTDGDYRMGYYTSDNEYVKTPNTIHLDSSYNNGDIITVYSFNNHDSQGIERQIIDVEERTELTEGTPLYYEYGLLKQGVITLRKPARSSQYVWVIKNGDLLTPSVDYSVTDNNLYVKLVQEPQVGDELQVIHFANQIVTNKFGFRIFKDMLNRTHYKRLDDIYQLAQPLNWNDTRIHVVDATGLPEPEYNAKYPGVIFINAERIEFFGRSGNELLQLRRGTLGTGVKDAYNAGEFFMEQGVDASMPYRDSADVITVTASGYSKGSELYENSTNVSISSITYNFNNNTAFPVRVPGVYEQVCTVNGTGFTDRVKVYVGETECDVTYISTTQLKFDVPGFNVPGAYDLIVVNPFTDVPIDTPQTSYVAPGAIKYVQILLPFAPIPNPSSETNWYKEKTKTSVGNIVPGRSYLIDTVGTTDFTLLGAFKNTVGTAFVANNTVPTGSGTVLNFSSIPNEYWEAQDIEVFVAGHRLRKTPISVYDYTAQDSPEGDKQVEAEFAVNKNIGAYVRLTTPPKEGTKVNIIRKIGTLWTTPGTTLATSESDVAKFLRAKTTDLPR